MSFTCSRPRTLRVVIAWLTLLGSFYAESIPQLKPSGYVNDFAHVLSNETVASLENLCLEVDQKTKSQIAVVTIHSLDGRDIESYASDLYKSWGIGAKSTNRGVLILLPTDDRRYRTEAGYGLEPTGQRREFLIRQFLSSGHVQIGCGIDHIPTGIFWSSAKRTRLKNQVSTF
jgi:uncharacterized membrane protein YgcG